MKKLIPLIAVVLVLTAASCKRNLCEGVVCNNLGTCVDGECSCTPGWTGTTCDVHTNPCDTTICYNGGVCNAGVCNCPGHTSGADCKIQEAPSHMAIHRLVIERFNPYDQNGAFWDNGDFADVYTIIKRGDSVIYDGTVWRKENATYDTWYSWLLGSDSIIINDITNGDYKMEMWDYDGGGGADTYMNGFNFTPYTDSTGFRGSIELTDTSFYHNKFIMHVYFNYSW